LRDASIVALLLIIVLAFGFSIFQSLLIRTSTEFTAAVLPSVLVDLANKDRVDSGLRQLTVSPILEEAARMKAEDMVEKGYFAHTSPSGLNPWYWFYRSGYEFIHAGENLAVNFVDSEDVEQAWMNSPGHRANILNGNFTEIGIAAVPGTYKGKKTIFVVQLFGTPSAIASTEKVERIVVTPEVAGEQTSNVAPADMYQQVTLAQEYIPNVSSQDVVGAVAQETVAAVSETAQVTASDPVRAPVEHAPQSTLWQKILTQPKMLLRVIYLIISVLISFVVILMFWYQVHRRHAREFLYGLALLLLIVLLLFLNYMLLSSGIRVV
jgi:uncharacterized protein YkwD